MLGERAQFLSRFLSPEVGKRVRYRGVDEVIRPKSLEITAVSCDLRGFTQLSQLLASDQVVRLLNEYYDAVGAAVAEFGGTIEDYAGDGVLILVGAPLPMDDHARQGLALANRLRQVARELISHWAGPEMRLGMGVGVASGKVTVGAHRQHANGVHRSRPCRERSRECPRPSTSLRPQPERRRPPGRSGRQGNTSIRSFIGHSDVRGT